jgi:uroporphyrinogen decarboxylase
VASCRPTFCTQRVLTRYHSLTMTNRENLLRTIRRDGPAWVPHRHDGSLTLLRPAVVCRPSNTGCDDWGVRWIGTNSPEGSYPDGKPVLSIDDVDSFEPPSTDWRKVTDDLRRQVEARRHEDTLLIAYNEMVLYERVQLLLGTTEFLMAVALAPERLELLLDRIATYARSLTQAAMEAGADGVRFTDDWGTQTSLFISPRDWKRLIKPRLKALYDTVKQHGGVVFQHSCGRIDAIVPDLVEIGLDVLDPCQPAANDIFQWKRIYGDRLSFMGGLDTQGCLTFGKPAEVEAEVAKVVAIMSAGGGYIAAPSHTITIPAPSRTAMLRAIERVNQSALEKQP